MKTQQSLQLFSQRRQEMSHGQRLLLDSMHECIKKNITLQMDDIVVCYYIGVKKTLYWTNYTTYNGVMCASGPHREYDILVEFEANSYIWNKKIRDLIKSWFVSAVGLLVIKGWLKVLPVIEIV